jgi:3-hydroxyisobutyrate dehydrogenase
MAGTTAATSGNLTIMFGSPSDLASGHAVPLLQRMAREGGVIPCGRNGTGVGVKVCNKYITLQ